MTEDAARARTGPIALRRAFLQNPPHQIKILPHANILTHGRRVGTATAIEDGGQCPPYCATAPTASPSILQPTWQAASDRPFSADAQSAAQATRASSARPQ